VRALVIDDSRATRMILRKILESVGFEVEQAENGRVALEMLESWVPYDVPDLALVDWNMPEMNGLELLRAVRADERFRKMPFVITSIDNSLERVKIARLTGVSAFVLKPFDEMKLRTKLDEVLLQFSPSRALDE
jgi:two-component system, chemotaxis family, chemotaxis protein CheY